LISWTGPIENGLQLTAWYQEGADSDSWPACQSKEPWATLIVVKPDGSIYEYETLPVAQQVEDTKMAWGSGRLAALAAMACGTSAVAAVEIAAQFDIWTGSGVTALRLRNTDPPDDGLLPKGALFVIPHAAGHE
jgi:hypothetical protein